MKNFNYNNLLKNSLAFLSCIAVITIAGVISFKGLFLCWYNKYIFFKRAIYNFIKASVNNLIPRIVSLIEVVLVLVLALFAVAYIIVTDRKTLTFIIFILFFILPLFSINYISLNQGFSCFPLMLYSGESKNLYFLIFLLIIIIFIISISSFIKNSFFNSNFYLNILIPFYKKNRAFFKLKNYYFFYFDKSDIFILLYIVLLIVFFLLMSSILDGSLMEVVTSLNIQVLLSVFISLIVICIGFFVKGIQEMFNLLHLYIYTVINIIPYICFVFFFFWIIVEPSFEDIINIMLIFRKYRLYFIMLISFIFIITNNVKGFYNILIIISLGNILSIFTIFVFDVIYQDVYTILSKSSINKPNNLIVSGLGGRWENLYREAVAEYKAILIENNKQLKEALNTSKIGYLKNMVNQIRSFFLDMDGFLNLFLSPNFQMHNIRFNAFFENFLKEKGLLKEVSTTNKLSLTKLDVWKLIAPMFTSSQINFFYPPKIQGLIEVVPMHQKIVVSKGIDYRVTLDRELKSGKLLITSSRIADGLTNTRCLTLSELLLWKVNCSTSNDKFSFWSSMQSNSTASKGSTELILLGKPNLPNINIVKEKHGDLILKNPSIMVDNWDGETLVGSDWENETVVGSESNVDLKVCVMDSLKLPDPQLNFSPEYLDENRQISVFVNKGKGIATSSDLTSDNEYNSDNPGVEYIDLNELANLLDEDDLNRAINESRQTNEYNLRAGESSSSGARGVYGQENNISINLHNEPAGLVENESVVSEPYDKLQEEIYGDYPTAGINGELQPKDRLGDLYKSAQTVLEFKDAQAQGQAQAKAQAQEESSRKRSRSSSLSSHNTEDFIDVWDKNLCTDMFTIYLNKLIENKEIIFDPEIFAEFLKEYNLYPKSVVDSSNNSTVSNQNIAESFNKSIPHFGIENLIFVSSNIVQNLNTSDTGEVANPRVKKKITLKPGQTMYSYTMRKLIRKRSNFLHGLKRKISSDLITLNEKEELTSKINVKYNEYKIAIKQKKNSIKELEDICFNIDKLLIDIWGHDTENRSFSNDKALNKKISNLRTNIYYTKYTIKNWIKDSTLSEEDKSWLLEQVDVIISNLRKQIDIAQVDQVDQLFEGIFAVQLSLKKQSELWIKNKLSSFFTKQQQLHTDSNYYPEGNESWIISRLFKNIRDDLISVIHIRLSTRIKTWYEKKLIQDKQSYYDEIQDKIDRLNMDMYFSSSLEDVCQKVIRVLLDLNHKYSFLLSRMVFFYSTNEFIYVRFREILEKFIKKD